MSGDFRLEKDGWMYLVKRGDELVAELQVDIHGDSAMLHHKVLRFGKDVWLAMVKFWANVRRDLRAAGVVLMIASSDNYDAKLGRYWKAMGFEKFGECESNGSLVAFAVMEA